MKFDPWDIVALPVWWAILAGYTIRDWVERLWRVQLGHR